MEEVERSKDAQDESSPMEDRPSSPIDCAICLEQLTDKSFTNSCFHMFCFHCLLAWSKVKPECPLCKQDFCSIIHNIRSMDDYDEYRIPPSQLRFSSPTSNSFMPSSFDRHPANFFAQGSNFFAGNRDFFSYRTTFMPRGYSFPAERSSSLVIQPYVDNLQIQNDFPIMNRAQSPVYTRFNRKDVYQKELEIRPPVVSRYRVCSPTFYRENEGQLHRLGRWLIRELVAISQTGMRFSPTDVLALIMDMLPVYEIQGAMFRSAVFPYLGVHTGRFIREFYNFAISPYELEQYDRECTYIRHRNGSRLSFIVTVGGGDDTEDVQVIPNRSMSSLRPWIDVNDLTSPRYNSIYPENQVRNMGSNTPWRWHSHSLPSNRSSSTSFQVIDITDSENDDCVIIEEVRNAPETIVLDDSDCEQTSASPVPGTSSCNYTSPLDLSAPTSIGIDPVPSTSTGYVGQYSTCKREPSIIESDCSVSISRHAPLKRSRSNSSVLSTDNSILDTEPKARKRKLHNRKSNSSKRTKRGLSSERAGTSHHVTCSTSEGSDKEDGDWMKDRYRKKKKKLKKRADKDSTKKSVKKHKKTVKECKSYRKRRSETTATVSESDLDDCCAVYSRKHRKTKHSSTSKAGAGEGSAVQTEETVKKSVPDGEVRNHSVGGSTGQYSGTRLRSVLKKVINSSVRGGPETEKCGRWTTDDGDAVPSTSFGFIGYKSFGSTAPCINSSSYSDWSD